MRDVFRRETFITSPFYRKERPLKHRTSLGNTDLIQKDRRAHLYSHVRQLRSVRRPIRDAIQNKQKTGEAVQDRGMATFAVPAGCGLGSPLPRQPALPREGKAFAESGGLGAQPLRDAAY